MSKTEVRVRRVHFTKFLCIFLFVKWRPILSLKIMFFLAFLPIFFFKGGASTRLNRVHCTANTRIRGLSRIFYLQVLTTPDVMGQISTELDLLRRGFALKSLLDGYGVGRAEFLLEALILLIETFKTECPKK